MAAMRQQRVVGDRLLAPDQCAQLIWIARALAHTSYRPLVASITTWEVARCDPRLLPILVRVAGATAGSLRLCLHGRLQAFCSPGCSAAPPVRCSAMVIRPISFDKDVSAFLSAHACPPDWLHRLPIHASTELNSQTAPLPIRIQSSANIRLLGK